MGTLTLVHVLISLAGILSGFVVAFGLVMAKRYDAWTAFFLLTTVATSATGFLFPFKGFTPAIGVGVISLLVLAVALFARYARRLAGPWRATYVITAMCALYFNFFVLIAQSFQKIPALKNLAPTQTEWPFALAQLAALGFFVVLTVFAVRKFRHEQTVQNQMPLSLA